VPTKAFANSQILNRDRLSLQNILNQWYTGAGAGGVVPPSWKLAFRASQHDFSATEFHRICDGIAPLYIIILGHKGQVNTFNFNRSVCFVFINKFCFQ